MGPRGSLHLLINGYAEWDEDSSICCIPYKGVFADFPLAQNQGFAWTFNILLDFSPPWNQVLNLSSKVTADIVRTNGNLSTILLQYGFQDSVFTRHWCGRAELYGEWVSYVFHALAESCSLCVFFSLSTLITGQRMRERVHVERGSVPPG